MYRIDLRSPWGKGLCHLHSPFPRARGHGLESESEVEILRTCVFGLDFERRGAYTRVREDVKRERGYRTSVTSSGPLRVHRHGKKERPLPRVDPEEAVPLHALAKHEDKGRPRHGPGEASEGADLRWETEDGGEETDRAVNFRRGWHRVDLPSVESADEAFAVAGREEADNDVVRPENHPAGAIPSTVGHLPPPSILGTGENPLGAVSELARGGPPVDSEMGRLLRPEAPLEESDAPDRSAHEVVTPQPKVDCPLDHGPVQKVVGSVPGSRSRAHPIHVIDGVPAPREDPRGHALAIDVRDKGKGLRAQIRVRQHAFDKFCRQRRRLVALRVRLLRHLPVRWDVVRRHLPHDHPQTFGLPDRPSTPALEALENAFLAVPQVKDVCGMLLHDEWIPRCSNPRVEMHVEKRNPVLLRKTDETVPDLAVDCGTGRSPVGGADVNGGRSDVERTLSAHDDRDDVREYVASEEPCAQRLSTERRRLQFQPCGRVERRRWMIDEPIPPDGPAASREEPDLD